MAVFCSARDLPNNMSVYIYEMCKELAKTYDLIWGYGIAGCMGVVYKAFKDAGADCYGYGIKEFTKNEGIPDIPEKNTKMYSIADRSFVNGGLGERTSDMCFDADAILVLPGGVGTLLELCMAYVLKQSKYSKVPIVVFNKDGYYGELYYALAYTSVYYGTMSRPNKYVKWLTPKAQSPKEYAREIYKAFNEENETLGSNPNEATGE